MSREKQIEEMAKVIDKAKYDMCMTKEHPSITVKNHSKKIAEALYNADYRKQSEGEWLWTENGEADCEKYWVCSVCKEHDFVKTKYCPNCGAKMKGGAE